MFELFKRVVGRPASAGGGIPGSLRGRYDIFNDTLKGYVRTEHGTDSAGMEIVVLRNGEPVFSCTPGPVTADFMQPFSLVMDGRFKSEELARGTVVIGARNRRGDTGALILHGSTMLELVRDHCGVPSETIFDLNFTEKGNARPFLGAGWSRAEQEYTWATDDDSVVTFPAPQAAGEYLLRLTCVPFLVNTVPVQLLDIKLDGVTIASLQDSERVMRFREFRIEGSDFTARPTSTLQLVHVNAARPSVHLGSGDTRRLAFRFRRMSLVRVLQKQG
jgi:hypothetical protein